MKSSALSLLQQAKAGFEPDQDAKRRVAQRLSRPIAPPVPTTSSASHVSLPALKFRPQRLLWPSRILLAAAALGLATAAAANDWFRAPILDVVERVLRGGVEPAAPPPKPDPRARSVANGDETDTVRPIEASSALPLGSSLTLPGPPAPIMPGRSLTGEPPVAAQARAPAKHLKKRAGPVNSTHQALSAQAEPPVEVRARKAFPPTTPTPPPVASSVSQIRTEATALKNAHQALEKGKPDQALRALQQLQRKVGPGVLQQEQAALRARALCQAAEQNHARRAEARRAASQFRRRYPNSVFEHTLRGCL